MSTYSQYGANSFSDDIVANESYDGIVGAYTAVEENAINEHRIFESVIGRDFTEAYVAAGALDESALEAVNEASLGGIWEKVKAFFKKMAEKILGVIKSIKDRVVIAFTRDGKELVKKYDKQIVKKINTQKMKNFKFTFYGEVRKDDLLSKDPAKAIETVLSTTELANKMYTCFGNTKSSFSNIEKVTSKGEIDEKILLTDDQLSDLKEKAYQSISDNEATNRAELMKFATDVSDADETEGLTIDMYKKIVNTLKDGQAIIKKLNDSENKVKKIYSNIVKDAEDIQNKVNKIAQTEKYNKAASLANAMATNTIKMGNALTNIATDALAASIAETKLCYKNARSIFTRAATYGGKDEAAFMEAVSQVSDYEVEQIFE